MLKRGAGLVLLAGLAGCDDGAQPAGVTKVEATSAYVEQLKGLSELNRGLALRRAVQDSGGTCKRPESSGFQENYRNMSMWTVRCPDAKDWAIFIAPNADVQVRSCADAAALELPACRFEGEEPST